MTAGSIANSRSLAQQRTTTISPALRILKMLGSLKVTVAMFALAIIVVFVGTLAQDEMDLAQVKREFFTCWVAWIPLDVFLPITLFEHDSPVLGGAAFPFPGGATIGLILLVNLIAAKATRFSVYAKGAKLWLGLLTTAIGGAIVAAVISAGHATDGLQGQPPIEYAMLWNLLKGGLVVMTLALLAYAIRAKLPPLARILVGVSAVISLGLTVTVLMGGEAVRLDDPGLRIVWQLLQATIASCVLLAGLIMIFGRRGGNVLIHIGVGLLMVGQFVFGDRQIEQRIELVEGSATNLSFIIDELELVLIDTSDPEEDTVHAIPESLIRKVDKSQEVIDDPDLPCKVRIVDWMRNSELVSLKSDEKTIATAGIGLSSKAVEKKPIGAAMSGRDRNYSAAYVELIDRQTDEPIETLLLSQERNDLAQFTIGMQQDAYESATIDGRPFEVALRYKQQRKPYEVFLKDVERIDYSGTETPRDYSSRIIITDLETGDSQEGKTWMNNPIRYRGETFYQSSYNKVPIGGKLVETTGLQVVKNAGWVIPYVCCMMVFVGMFAHFGGTFVRFASRYARGALPGTQLARPKFGLSLTNILIATGSLAVCAGTAAYFARPEKNSRSEVDWRAINQLPVQHEGRIKSFDSVAKNVLQRIAKPIFGMTPTVKDDQGERRSPSEWLLGVMAGQEWVKEARVFRIYSTEVQDLFELEPSDNSRYAFSELQPKMDAFRAEIDKLRGKEPDSFDFREQKLAEAHGLINLFDLISLSYQMPPIPDPTQVTTEEQSRIFMERFGQVRQMMQQLEAGGPPSMVPPMGEATEQALVDAKWQALGPAIFDGLFDRITAADSEPNPALLPLDDLLSAVRKGDAPEINKAVSEYQEQLAELPLANAKLKKARAESWLNKFNPTIQGVVLYILAMVLGFAGFLFASENIRKATFWLLVGVFVIHTVAIVARVYISGRAPVINLYSSAVFIGWACVLLSLVLEGVFPLGIANLVAGLIGASTLSVARFLDTEDTLPVLQAVLDTQFWLSTHVITVTAGYAVTFLAGFIGICALVHRLVTRLDAYPAGQRPQESEDFQLVLYRMIYGIVCFAIFFSFIGTVLGGLWADDSWGRFWGWDPKENGALMIVLWNALILHARWDKQVGPRGFAVLAVLGNVMTAWSWFGTNQLGIGLHSYGFTTGALTTLLVFIIGNILFAIGCLIATNLIASGGRSASDVK